MNKIGSYQFLTLDGVPHPGGASLEDITRRNAEGVALRQIARTTGPFQMTSCVDVATVVALKTALEGYQSLRGTLVTVEDAYGNTWSGVAVLNVEPQAPKPAAVAVGGLNIASGANGVLLEAVWTLQLTSLPAGVP